MLHRWVADTATCTTMVRYRYTASVAPFEVRDGLFDLRYSELDRQLGQVRATGSIDLAGRADLGLSLSPDG